jgi:hypothetical protein
MDGLSIALFNQVWFKSELELLGHRVITVGQGSDRFDLRVEQFGTSLEAILSQLPFNPTHLVFFDDSRAPWVTGLEQIPIPKIFLSIDTHHHSWWHDYYARLFDRTLYSQPGYAPDGESWFPLWCSAPVQPEGNDRFDVVFRGNLDTALHPRRAQFFRELTALHPVDVASGDWRSIFPRARIVVNQSVASEINFRVFEAMLSGALLLNPRGTAGMDLLFEEGVHYVGYHPDDPLDCATRIKELLADDDRRVRIARAGYEQTRLSHTTEVRARQLVEILKGLNPRDKQWSPGASFMALAPSFADAKNVGSILNQAVELALRAIREESFPSTDREANSLVFLLNVLLKTENHSQLLSLSRALPERLEYRLFEIAALIGLGDQHAAWSAASAVSNNPAEFIAVIPSVLGGVMEECLGKA